MPLYSDMHRFIPAMSIPMGARVAEVGVRHHARQFGESKYGLSRIFKVLLDLIVIKTLLIFARHPLARFSGVASVAVVVAVIALLAIPFSTPSVVPMTVAALAASLAVFLILLGLVTGVLFQSHYSRNSSQQGPADNV